MALRQGGKVLIDVGLNEFTTKEQNPHAPYTPAEVARDAVDCVTAGASSIHFHARTADGGQSWGDARFYRDAMALVAAEIPVPLWYSTYNTTATADSPDGHAHDWSMHDDPISGAPLEMVAFDVPQGVPTASLLWNEAAVAFERVGFDTVSSGEAVDLHPPELAEAARRGLVPVVGAFDVGHVRWCVLAMRAGVLPTPAVVKLVLSGEMVLGPFADAAGIDAYLSQIPDDFAAECMVEPYLMTDGDACDAVVGAALDRGLGVRVGIGDSPEAFPDASNRELVARVVEMARARGLEPASPDDARQALGLAAPSSRRA